jgi:hypothetical protein
MVWDVHTGPQTDMVSGVQLVQLHGRVLSHCGTVNNHKIYFIKKTTFFFKNDLV